MHTLILIKHSNPEIKADVPAKFWDLSTEGRERAANLAEKLAKYAPQTIVSSDEPKAIQTAQIVADVQRIPHHVAQNLHEHDRSNILANDGQSQFEAKVASFFERPDDLVYGLETATTALSRFSLALDEVIDRFPVDTLAVVAHGTVITLYVAEACVIDPFPFWKSLQLPSYVVLSMPTKRLVEAVPSIEHDS
jgi:broad specificity phosphatase PhoE